MIYDKGALRSEIIQKLINIGVLIDANSVDFYHGRARLASETEEWKVDPLFNSASNNTGNHNVYGISTISTASYKIASKFASQRSKEIQGSVPEVIKIKPYSDGAVIFDGLFKDSELTIEGQKEYSRLIKLLKLPRVSEGMIVKFEERQQFFDAYSILQQERRMKNISYLSNIVVEKIAIENGLDVDLSIRIAGAINACILVANDPIVAMTRFALSHGDKRNSFKVKTEIETVDCPLNSDYVGKWLTMNNIIGVKSSVDSATLGSTISAVFMFDITKVNTENEVRRHKENTERKFESLNPIVDEIFKNNPNLRKELLTAKPEEVIEVISKTSPLAKTCFERNSNVWEGFTIGQHTETVLRVFESSYNLKVTEDIVPLIKLLIALHDSEKATENNKNNEIMKQILNELKIDANSFDFIIGMIYPMQKYAGEFFVQKHKSVISDAKRLSHMLATDLIGKDKVQSLGDERVAKSVMSITKILQTCDGASYTPDAVTRGERFFYHNANNRFAESFNIIGIDPEFSLK